MADEEAVITTEIKDGELEVTKTVQQVQVTKFTYDYLVTQRDSIQAQKDRDNEQRDKELAEINILIKAAKDGGIDVKADSGSVITPK